VPSKRPSPRSGHRSCYCPYLFQSVVNRQWMNHQLLGNDLLSRKCQPRKWVNLSPTMSAIHLWFRRGRAATDPARCEVRQGKRQKPAGHESLWPTSALAAQKIRPRLSAHVLRRRRTGDRVKPSSRQQPPFKPADGEVVSSQESSARCQPKRIYLILETMPFCKGLSRAGLLVWKSFIEPADCFLPHL
jgi:hypothetical protein